MSYGGVGDTVATPKNGGDFYKHTAQGSDSVRSSTASQYDGFSAGGALGSSTGGNNNNGNSANFFEDKVLFWSSVVVTILFACVLVPLGGVSAYKLYTQDTSNFYDFDDSVSSIITQSDNIAKQYAGATMNLAPVFINVQMNNPNYYIDVSPQSQKMFYFASQLAEHIGNSTPYAWGLACSDVASHFSDGTAYPEKYISSDHYSALFRLAWRHDKVNQNEEDSLRQFIRDSAAYADGNFTFTLTGPGLMQTQDTPAYIIGFFVPLYLVIFFFAVMARTSPVSLVVPAIFVTCTTTIAAGSLLIVDHRLPVTSFSIVICIATALSMTGMSTIALMQRLASNYMYDESHSRSISRRVYLAYTDMKETMFLPFVMAILMFCVSAIKDEACRSITTCCGLACMVIFMCNYTLLPACAIFTYPLVFPESPRWISITSCLPRHIRRATAEEQQSAQLLSSAAGHENDGKPDDSVLLMITSASRKYCLPAILGGVILYVVYVIVLFSTSMKVRYDYDSVVRHEDEFVESLQTVSKTYGVGAMEPWFIILELEPTTQFLSQNDFNRLTQMVNSVLSSPVMKITAAQQMVSPTLLGSTPLTFSQFEDLLDNENISPDALRFRNVFRSTVTADAKYAVLKLFPPSMADNFLNTYAEYMMHVEHFAGRMKIAQENSAFYGAFGPSAGMWDAMNAVNDATKIVIGVGCIFVVVVYALITRAAGATAHGCVATGLNLMRAFFYAAIATGFGGFYYAVTPVVFVLALVYFLHADVINVLEMLKIRERNRFTEERCNAELINRTEHVRWGWLVVFCTYFLMVFSLTEILTTVGLCISMLAIGDLILYRLIVVPAFNTLIAERLDQVRGYWWPRDVNEPRRPTEELQV